MDDEQPVVIAIRIQPPFFDAAGAMATVEAPDEYLDEIHEHLSQAGVDADLKVAATAAGPALRWVTTILTGGAFDAIASVLKALINKNSSKHVTVSIEEIDVKGYSAKDAAKFVETWTKLHRELEESLPAGSVEVSAAAPRRALIGGDDDDDGSGQPE